MKYEIKCKKYAKFRERLVLQFDNFLQNLQNT